MRVYRRVLNNGSVWWSEGHLFQVRVSSRRVRDLDRIRRFLWEEKAQPMTRMCAVRGLIALLIAEDRKLGQVPGWFVEDNDEEELDMRLEIRIPDHKLVVFDEICRRARIRRSAGIRGLIALAIAETEKTGQVPAWFFGADPSMSVQMIDQCADSD